MAEMITLGRLMAAAFILAAFGLLLMFIALLDASHPEPTNNRRVQTPVVAPGERLVITNGLTTPTTCNALIYRTVYDGEGTRVYSESEYKPGVPYTDVPPVHVLRAIPIPDYADPGPAEYHVVVEWQCNFVQRLFPQIVELPVLDFTLRKAP
jgi:hypothetical protein